MSTFVLVHGAWHGGWCWRDVRTRLEAAGHTVFTPTMPGLAERAGEMSPDITMQSFVNTVVDLLRDQDLTDVILVGHSHGGPVVSGAADALAERDRIRHLVLLDAAVLEGGETSVSRMDPEIVRARVQFAREMTGGVAFPVPPAEGFGVTEPEQVAFLNANLTPHPVGSYTSPLFLSDRPGAGLPCTYVICGDPIYEPLTPAHDRARSYGWEMRTIATGHDLMVSAPDETAALLIEIAENS